MLFPQPVDAFITEAAREKRLLIRDGILDKKCIRMKGRTLRKHPQWSLRTRASSRCCPGNLMKTRYTARQGTKMPSLV